MLAALIGISMGWLGEIFDVRSAFLSGLALQRKIHVRAPKEGLPGTNTTTPILPYQLMQVLKCAYGLTEAPRLWYLRAKQLLESIGFVEMLCAKAVFTLRNAAGKLITILVLHVDDALIFRDRTDPTSRRARQQLDKKFDIKSWKTLEEKPVTYLGQTWRQFEDRIGLRSTWTAM